ncbi:MAG TPA: peptidoglycan-binding domain-containing protein [Candidatus Paceibacterota bacterium]
MPVLAGNLSRLRAEINVRWPNRDKSSDGWIGDAAHQSRTSDHNPDSRGIVHAIDVDKDGIDANFLVSQCIKHPTCKYVIWNRTIWERAYNFSPRAYTGTDPHTGHVHVSGLSGSESENNTQPWGVASSVPPVTPPSPPSPGSNAPGTRVCKLTSPMMSGPDVKFIQTFIGPRQCGAADGIFGRQTKAGVVWYQRMRGIKADGEVGPQTWGQMGVAWRG